MDPKVPECPADEALSADRLEWFSPGRFGRYTLYMPQVDSTNRALFAYGLEGAPEGLVVVAEEQSAGRGRLGRAWFSPPGVNLYLSVLLRPAFGLERVPMLNLVAAVAAQEAFRKHGLEVGIKWPNDLLAGEPPCKVAGILAELSLQGAQGPFVVLGVGFDLNLPADEFPLELRGLATSFRALTGEGVDRAAFAGSFLHALQDGYDRFTDGGPGPVLEAWRKGSVTLGRRVQVALGTGLVEGQAEDIDQDGSLLVRTGQGLVKVTAGDVSLVSRPDGLGS